jgi:DNA-binding transcriptional MocR family regulator
MIGHVSDESELYRQVAAHVRTLIEQGTLKPGDRVPSVRRLSRQQGVSISTVMEAFRLLEDCKLVQARPRSGYYVRNKECPRLDEPRTAKPQTRPALITTAQQAMQVLRDIRDPKLVPLGAAVPSMEHLPVQALGRMLGRMGRLHAKACAQYDIPPGNLPFRQQVARRAIEAGSAVSPDEIVMTNGTMEALTLALRAVARPGETVIIESPVYFGILMLLESLGLKALEVPTSPSTGLDLAALEVALQRHTVAACLLNLNFLNPLGCVMPDENKKKLVQILSARQIPLIEDDIYGELSFSHQRPKAAKAYDREGLVLWCGSFSKTLCPGYRTGWIAPGRYQNEVERLKMLHTVASPAVPFLAVAAYLESGGYDRHLRSVRSIYKENVERLGGTVAEHLPAGTRVTRPQGGFTLWVEWPGGADAMEVYRQTLAQGISIAPGPIFTATNRYRNCMRLNAGVKWSATIENAVQRLGEIIDRLSQGAARAS